MKIHLFDKIISPHITEKATNLSEQNKIIFKVPTKANKKNLKKSIEKIFKVNVTKINIINKKSIKKSIEKIFKVNVVKINTVNMREKLKIVRNKKAFKSGYKKAIVTLKKGQSIDLATGI